MSTLSALAAAAVIAACGSGESPSIEATTCTYDFEATVREGPSAPFQTQGALVVATDSDGNAAGVYRPYDATSVDDLLVPDVAAATEVAIGLIDIGPEPIPGSGGDDVDPSSLDTFDSLPRTGTLGNTLVDAFVNDELEFDGLTDDHGQRFDVPGEVPYPFAPDPQKPSGDCEPDELGDGDCIQ